MAKAPSGYVPLNMNFLRDADIRRAGAEAEHLYIRSLAHAKAGQTDGFIGDFDLPVVAVGMKNAAKRAKSLVEVGLWIEADGGWRIRNWAKWNMTGEEIRTDKAKKRDAAVLTNHQRWHVDKGVKADNCPHCKGSPPPKRVATPIATPIADESLSEVKSSEVKSSEVNVVSDVATATPPAGADATPNSGDLIAEWITHCSERPPSRVIGQVSKEVKSMLSEGIDYDRVRSGLAEWNRKGLHPSTLASVVHEIANKRPKSETKAAESTTDARVKNTLAIAKRLREQEQADEQRAIGQNR